MKKTKIITFQKRSRLQRSEPTFEIGGTQIKHMKTCTHLGLQISSTGNFCCAVKELREKAKRAFYAIKRSVQIQTPIRTWLKIFKSAIEQIALYGSEVWGPSLQHDRSKWDKNPTETCVQSSAKASFAYKEKAQTLHGGLNQDSFLYFQTPEKDLSKSGAIFKIVTLPLIITKPSPAKS